MVLFRVFSPLKDPKSPIRLLAQGFLTCKRARAACLISGAGQELRAAPGLGQVSSCFTTLYMKCLRYPLCPFVYIIFNK